MAFNKCGIDDLNACNYVYTGADGKHMSHNEPLGGSCCEKKGFAKGVIAGIIVAVICTTVVIVIMFYLFRKSVQTKKAPAVSSSPTVVKSTPSFAFKYPMI